MTHPPCIVCGRRRGHDGETHDRYRHEYRRTKNLLRRTWPRLAGLRRLLDFYAAQAPQQMRQPADRRPVDWVARVLPGGVVGHYPVYADDEEEFKDSAVV